LERTRIVLIDMSPLLRDILREALSREPDLEVVGEHEAGIDVRAAVEGARADFVILGTDAAAADGVREVVGPDRRVRALEVAGDGRQSVLYELRPHREPLGEISPETLLRTIRAAPAWDANDDTSERRTA
jgi:DNA-binding NarL/FixJ family response regulator